MCLKNYKNVLRKMFMIALFIGMFFALSNLYAYTIDEYTINATVLKNGNMQVEELLKYKFNESKNGVFRDLLYRYNFSTQKDNMEATSSRYQANGVINIKAYYSNNSFEDMGEAIFKAESELTNGMNGYYSIADTISDGYRKNIKVYTPATSGSYKYIKYTYEIEDVAVKYNDMAEIYWNFIGGDWECDINNFTLNIAFENKEANMNSIKVFPHGYLLDLSYNIYDDEITITSKNVPGGVALDARVVFDKDALEFATKTIDSNYELDTLEKIESKMSFDRTRYFISILLYFIVGVSAIIVFVIICKKSQKIANKGKKNKKDIEIYTDILDKLPLTSYSLLNNKNLGINNPFLLLSTILDLSNRKYILMDAKKKLKKSKYSDIEYDYNMKLDVSKDYSKLTSYEQNVINYLFNGKIGDNIDISTFKTTEIELNDRFKNLSKNTSVITRYAKFCNEENIKEQNVLYEKTAKKNTRFALTSVIILVILLFINIFIISPLNFEIKFSIFIPCTVISAFYSIFAIFIPYNSRSVKQEYIDEYNNLKGLEKYLNEYSVMKERFPIEIALWGKYLVFATLFGIADKVSKEFKEELIKNGYDDDYIYST